KVAGGARKQLIFQFLGGSFVLCSIAFASAILMISLILPVFNELSNKSLAISYLFDAKLITAYIALFLLTGLLAGFYPALILSSYNPLHAISGRFRLNGNSYLQKSLVTVLFTLASFLIVATATVFSQFDYLVTKPLGYDDKD